MLLLGRQCAAQLQARMRAQRLLPMAESVPEDLPVCTPYPLPHIKQAVSTLSECGETLCHDAAWPVLHKAYRGRNGPWCQQLLVFLSSRVSPP